MLELKDVLDCNLVAGDFDYLLKIRVRDMADFNKLHGQKLIALPGIRQTRTFFVMKRTQLVDAWTPTTPRLIAAAVTRSTSGTRTIGFMAKCLSPRPHHF